MDKYVPQGRAPRDFELDYGVTVSVEVDDFPWFVAVIVTACETTTVEVVMVNDTWELNAGTVTVAGTEATPAFELVNETTVPDGPDFPFKTIVPVTFAPPFTVLGTVVTDRTHAGTRASEKFMEMVPNVAVSVTGVMPSTPRVGTRKFADALPAGIVTVAGGTMLVLEDARLTTVPPRGAAALNVTVPVGKSPPTMDDGATVNPINPSGFTVKVVVAEPPWLDAVTVTDCAAPTVKVVTANVP